MPSNPLPSSARSALREAAERMVAARDAALQDTHGSAAIYRALEDAKYALINEACQPERILALLSLAERGAEDTKRIERARGKMRFLIGIAEQGGVSGSWLHALCELQAILTGKPIASSPTGGTTE